MTNVKYEGKTYTLVMGGAHLTGTHENPYYEATAICVLIRLMKRVYNRVIQ